MIRQWDIFEFDHPDYKLHSFVIISPQKGLDANEFPEVNGLLCVTQRAGNLPKSHHVVLDQADGFDWATLVLCQQIFSIPKPALGKRRGSVSAARRKAIAQTLRKVFGLDL